MKKKFKLMGVGSPVVDLLAQVPESFVKNIDGAKGGMELIDTHAIEALIAQLPQAPTTAAGGSAGNTAFAAARLGLATTFLGKTGNCDSGRFYRDHFVKMGGDKSRFKMGTIPNGRCLSLITPDSERTMRTDLGAAMTLSPDDVSVADFAEAQHTHIEGYVLFNRDLMYRVLHNAQEAGCTISIDLASFEVVNATKDILPDLLSQYVDVVFANEEEADAFTGLGEDYHGMVKQLQNHCDIAVVKLGKKGSLIGQGDTLSEIAPVTLDNALDTTAAGDFWAAGFLYGWLTGKNMACAGSYGSILGAEVVQVLGTHLSEERWNTISQRFA